MLSQANEGVSVLKSEYSVFALHNSSWCVYVLLACGHEHARVCVGGHRGIVGHEPVRRGTRITLIVPAASTL